MGALSLAWLLGCDLGLINTKESGGDPEIADIEWTLDTTFRSPFFLYGVIYGDSQFVAVGTDERIGLIVTSPDGMTWTERVSNAPEGLRSVAWSGTTYVAVGGAYDRTSIVTSPDGINWTVRDPGIGCTLESVIWAGNQFVAVGYRSGYSGVILTSPDGVNWTNRGGDGYQFARSVVWTGTEIFVVGEPYNQNPGILVSSDGITWLGRSYPEGAYGMTGIGWSGSELLGTDGHRVYSSSDGRNWVKNSDEPDSLTAPGCFEEVIWAGTQWVGFRSNNVLNSPDGKHFKTQKFGQDGWPYPEYSPQGIAWNGSTLVMVGWKYHAESFRGASPPQGVTVHGVIWVGH